jgi:cell division septal protein FtsQ
MARKRKKNSSSAARRTGYRLEARAKRNAQPRDLTYRLGAIALLLAVVCGLLVALWHGSVAAQRLLYSENDKRYAIREIHVVDGKIQTTRYVKEWLDAAFGIRPGVNIFSFRMSELHAKYLELNHIVQGIRITRELPDKLHIVIDERDPIARLGQRGTSAVDAEGRIFDMSKGLHKLPVVVGCRDLKLEPGGKVADTTLSAVAVLAVCNEQPQLGLRVVGIDVSPGEHVVVHILIGGTIHEVPLDWEGFDTPESPDSRAALLAKLILVQQAAVANRGTHRRLDATYSDRIYGQ